jgi:quercetin dioxygenase-like cupin family protein
VSADDHEALAGTRDPELLALLAHGLPIAAPPPALRARLLATLRGPERYTPHAPALAEHFGVALADARHALSRIAEPAAWQPGPWPGSERLVTPALAAAATFIARLPAGLPLPHHRHVARELTYVLDGDLLEQVEHGGDLRHGRGAFLAYEVGTAHALTIGGTAPCLAVFSLRFA